MSYVLLGSIQSFFLGILLFFTSLFLIFIVLIQRGRGGGLSGALGGTGQSAFGSRAGDELTYITLVVAGGWIFLCIVCIWVMNPPDTNSLIGEGTVQTGTDNGSDGDNLLGTDPPDTDSDADNGDADNDGSTEGADDGDADDGDADNGDADNDGNTEGADDGKPADEDSTQDEPASPEPEPDTPSEDAGNEGDDS